MSGLEINKMAGALLVAGLVAVVSGKISGILYHDGKQPAERGYLIEVAEAAPAATASKEVDIAEYFAAADIAKGQKLAKACVACHSFDKGGKNKVGPNLYGIVGTNRGEVAGFKYSKAMAATSNEKWDVKSLSDFLEKPKKFLKGTKMAYSGLKKVEKRADLIAYLNSNSDAPTELPVAEAKVEEAVENADAAKDETAEKIIDAVTPEKADVEATKETVKEVIGDAVKTEVPAVK